ncbi:MAG: PEP/pyruvate-binding domain-containing protein [Planctomycetota bacterium]
MRALPLGTIPPDALTSAGGKAAGLARLRAAGLPVPDGFCLPAEAYSLHLDWSGLTPRIEAFARAAAGMALAERGAGLAAIRRSIEEFPLPPEAEAAAREAWETLAAGAATRAVAGTPGAAPFPFFAAVRSSATAEDLPGHSFAGQHDTFLGVRTFEECLAAIRRCYASLWSDRAVEYRTRRGIPHADVAMAIVIQRQADASAAGVLFTADPVAGRRDRIVIEAVRGLGEALVSGRASPERIVLARPGLAVVERAGSPGGEIVLGDGEAVALARLALRAEEALGAPADVEWAIEGGEIRLLQARPITALPAPAAFPVLARAEGAPSAPNPSRQVWTNANTGEVLPDVATPMTWSMAEKVVCVLLGSFFARLGMDLGGAPIVGRIAGRAYFNVNTLQAFLRKVPGLRGDALTEMFGGDQEAAANVGRIRFEPADLPDLKFSKWRLAARLPGLLWEFLTFSPRRGEFLVDQIRLRADKDAAVRPADLPDDEILERIRTILSDLEADAVALARAGVSQVYPSVLYKSCRKWFGEDGSSLASRLLAGLGNNQNAAAGIELARLVRLAAADPLVGEAVRTFPDAAALRAVLAGSEPGRRFVADFDAFLASHGHHARGEIELSNPRWSERPDEILATLRAGLDAPPGRDFLSRYETLASERARAEAEARARLKNPLKRAAFSFLVRKARTCPSVRENAKSQWVRRLAALRGYLLELGCRAAAEGRLADAGDVFFLRCEELEAFLGGALSRESARLLVDARRSEYEQNRKISPPSVVIGNFDPAAGAGMGGESGAHPENVLRGIPVHPGIVRGPARVILRADTCTVRPGEILVAPFTDPGWTPYFLSAAALVTDMGGLMSHGSIVAREFGLPAVVNTGVATKRIRTGQIIEVDGGRGTVRLEFEAAGGARPPKDSP